MRAIVSCVIGACVAAPLFADAPSRSLVPPMRPGAATPAAPEEAQASGKTADPVGAFFKRLATAQPKARPSAPPASSTIDAAPEARTQSPTTSARPPERPRGLLAALRAGGDGSSVSAGATMKGAVCGVPTIKGERVAAIPAKLKGCGLAEPVKVTSVGGVALTRVSTMDCATAQAFDTWVKTGVTPAVGKRGGGLAKIDVVAHYACRTRNNQPGAKISEHGRGKAVDIAGFVLANGETLTVLKDWTSGDAKIMRAAWTSACGPFGTVLGPQANRFHLDHFHVDTARYRSGPYCR